MRYLILCLLPTLSISGQWTLEEMTLEEKIGQLFVAPIAPLREEDHWVDWKRLLKECHIGNAIVKASDPASQIACLDRLQCASKIPLLIAADAEWGLGMRMSEAISFPKNLTLGAVQDLSLLEEMGRWIGRQGRRVGIHLNLAPVADVNSNPLNPIIHMRSFGENPVEVAQRCTALIRGMKGEGLLTCAKHFPGHGGAIVDSHHALPVLAQNEEQLKQVELIPFEAAIHAGVECIMSGHLTFPALDDVPSSLSKHCMTHLLRESLGFQGLAITDALNMRALTHTWTVEEIALQAYAAGNDLLLYGAHLKEDVDELMRDQIPRAFQALHKAFLNDSFSIADLDARVRRILDLKERCQFVESSPFVLDQEALHLKRTLYRDALTLIDGPLPQEQLVSYIAIGGVEDDWLVQHMRKAGITVTCLDLDETYPPAFQGIVGLHRVKSLSEEWGLSEGMKRLLQESSLAILFCTPYVVQIFEHCKPILVAYENDVDAQEAVWDVLTGILEPRGCLPLFILHHYSKPL